MRNTAPPLHFLERFLADDPVARGEVCEACLEPLMAALTARFPGADPQYIGTAAGNALMSLIARPEQYDATRGPFWPWLVHAAICDFYNACRSDVAYAKRRLSLAVVEDDVLGGNNSEADSPPALLIAEEEATADRAAFEQVEQRLSPEDRPTLRLMRAGVRESDAYTEHLGVADRPIEERKRAVKRSKDRVMATARRSGRGTDEHSA